MDPITAGVISGLIVEGIKEVIYLGRQSPDVLANSDSLEQALSEQDSLHSVIEKSLRRADLPKQFVASAHIDELRDYLRSPEAEAIVRQIFASSLNEDNNSLASIREELAASLRLQIEEIGQDGDAIVTELFDVLVETSNRGLEIAIENGILSAHEAKSAFRYRALRDELAVVHKNLEFLTQDQKPDVNAILEFERKYRRQVASRYDSITPPYVEVARRVPIEQLYVPPSFIGYSGHQNEGQQTARRLRTHDLLTQIYRAVLLGNPGSGKSTFAKKLTYDLATRYAERRFAQRLLTPILVVLRDYGAQKRATNCSILQFIEQRANADHQLEPPRDAFKYLLLNGRAMVIFDGLDELLDTSYRQEISSDVESFCTLLPSVPVVVTSRLVGYEQAPLDERRFNVFRLSDFNEQQVREYATKWFSINTDLSSSERETETESFLAESQIVPDLQANPLMLGLMCNIYKGENYIPRNRPEVYKKCADMLFEKWDRSRGIRYSLPFEAHVRHTMMYLAYWIYSNEALQGGATEQQLVKEATDYLFPEQFENRDEAALAAKEFIEFCRGRAWVFTDTGTTGSGERLYQFTHRTFLEYFTAGHLTRTYYTPDKLLHVLLPKISRREWDIVAQLAFQMQSEAAAGAGDELLESLLERANEDEGSEGQNCLSFAVRSLEFMVPSSTVRSAVTAACAEQCLTETGKKFERRDRAVSFSGVYEAVHPEYDSEYSTAGLLANLTNVGVENRATVSSKLEERLLSYAAEGNDSEAAAALEIAACLPIGARGEPLDDRRPSPALAEFWKGFSNHVIDKCSTRLRSLAPIYFELASTALFKGYVSIDELMEWHSAASLFRYRDYLAATARQVPIVTSYVGRLLIAPYETDADDSWMEAAVRDVRAIGRYALTVPLPWVRSSQGSLGSLTYFTDRIARYAQKESKGINGILQVDSELLFGLFVLLATLIELENSAEERHRTYPDDNLRLRYFWTSRFLNRVFTARSEDVEPSKVQVELDACDFTPEQQSFVWRWVRSELSLVKAEDRER